MENKELREKIAAIQHEQWSGWMNWMLSAKSVSSKEGKVIPNDCYERWLRQMNTPYSELPENEKDSDRIEADKIMKLIAQAREEEGRAVAEAIRTITDEHGIIMDSEVHKKINNVIKERYGSEWREEGK